MITHSEAGVIFKRCRDKGVGYRLAKHTRLQKRGNAFAVRYHKTDVVMIRPDGTYRINSGGWRTPTTKARMNKVLPCVISQVNGIWYAGVDNTYYTDGMLIGPDGKAINAKPIGDIQKIKRMVDRRVNKFIQFVLATCSGKYIGHWEKYNNNKVPVLSNKNYLKNLWRNINTALNERYTAAIGESDFKTCVRLIYLAVLSRGYKNPKNMWQLMGNDCSQGDKSHLMISDLRTFIRPRKILIAEMIALGELE